MGLDDIAALYAAKPIDIPDEPVLLIRVSRAFQRGMTDADLYEITRSWWRLGNKRLRAKWAFAVFGGVVRAVYRIEGWETPSQDMIDEDPRRLGRWGFTGTRDPAMEDKYLFGNVTAYLPMAAQNPIRYINC